MSMYTCFGKCLQRSFLRKQKRIFESETEHEVLEKTLSLWDLICIGVAGTVGSGVFVLTGMIAHEYSGPSVVISWIVAGVCCLFSAVSYAELSSRIPSAGSSYAYVYNALGELPAVVAAWCLTLEYGISGAAVARSWGEKFGAYLQGINFPVPVVLDPQKTVLNIWAALMQAICTGLMVAGVELSKLTINFFSTLKVLVVVFIIVIGLMYFKEDNITIMAPYGYGGIMRGTTSAFFGYVGYDEVCCMAAEAHDPKNDLPKAVFGTIGVVTFLYVMASLALVGMIRYDNVATENGFSSAFAYCDNDWAQQIVALGELVTLPVVVLVSFLAQPRLQYAMARDGLLPEIFGEVDKNGNLLMSILISGFLCTLIALFVPFTNLNDMISAGVLISFNLTNSSLIIIRYDKGLRSLQSTGGANFMDDVAELSDFENEAAMDEPTTCGSADTLIQQVTASSLLEFIFFQCEYIYYRSIQQPIELQLCAFHLFSIIFSFSVTYCNIFSFQVILPITFICLVLYSGYIIFISGKDPVMRSYIGQQAAHYMVPYVPFTPLVGILVNYYLFAQLSAIGLVLIVSYIALAISFYYTYGYKHSVGNNTRWAHLFVKYLSRTSSINSAKNISRQNSMQPLANSGNTSPNTGLSVDNLIECTNETRWAGNSKLDTREIDSIDRFKKFSGESNEVSSNVYSPIPNDNDNEG